MTAIVSIDAGIIAYRYLTPARTNMILDDLREIALRLDPDVASADALAALPGLSARQARAIVEYRADHRDATGQRRCFHTAADLDHVYGIGPKTVARIRDYLQFPPPFSQLEQ